MCSTVVTTIRTAILHGNHGVVTIHSLVAVAEVLAVAIVLAVVVTAIQHAAAASLADVAGGAVVDARVSVTIGAGVAVVTGRT